MYKHGKRLASVIDKEATLRRLGGDRELLIEFIEVYFEDHPALLEKLQRAVEQRDADLIHRSAHNLKGLISNFSAHSAVAATAAIEKKGHDRNFEDIEDALAKLENEIALLDAALRQLSNE